MGESRQARRHQGGVKTGGRMTDVAGRMSVKWATPGVLTAMSILLRHKLANWCTAGTSLSSGGPEAGPVGFAYDESIIRYLSCSVIGHRSSVLCHLLP